MKRLLTAFSNKIRLALDDRYGRWGVVVLLIAVVSVGGMLLTTQGPTPVADTTKAAEVTQASIIAAVGQLIVLPTDEEPTIATVTNPEALATQTFFANAKQGDKVLIYPKAQKAILYDPQIKKILEVAPINLTPNSSSPK